MRVSHCWCALLMLGCAQFAHADESANDEVSSMEIIELLGEMEDDTGDLEIAMSEAVLDGMPEGQEVENAK